MSDPSLRASEASELEHRIVRLVGSLRRRDRDTSTVEVKAAVGGMPRSLPETVSAFSNSHGGTVVLGLEEGSGFLPAIGFDAIRVAEQVKELIRARVHGEPRGPLEPTPVAVLDIVEFEGAQLVVLEVEELRPDLKPAFLTARGMENGSYERLLDGDHRLGTHAVFLLHSNRSQPQDDRATVDGAIDTELDETLVQGLIARVRRTRPRLSDVARSDVELLRLLHVVDEKQRPTVAGLLALGEFPQERFPQLMVSFAVFPSTSKDDDVRGVRMLDRATFEGPIPFMVRDALQRIEGALSSRRLSVGARSVDVPEIPMEAVREALVNALAHRDYSVASRSEQVRIELYSDRLDIVSPGGIWGGRTERELLDGGSKSRNESLTRLLSDVPLGSSAETVSENQGTGIRYMLGSMKRSGLPVPQFSSRPTAFTASLSRHGLLDDVTSGWLASIGADALDERSRSVLALSASRPDLDDQVVRYQLDMDSFDARELLLGLLRDGWLAQGSRGRFFLGARSQQALLPVDLSERPSDREDDIVRALSGGSKSVHQLADELGLSVNIIRNRLRTLVESGSVSATAPPTSRLRRYRLP